MDPLSEVMHLNPRYPSMLLQSGDRGLLVIIVTVLVPLARRRLSHAKSALAGAPVAHSEDSSTACLAAHVFFCLGASAHSSQMPALRALSRTLKIISSAHVFKRAARDRLTGGARCCLEIDRLKTRTWLDYHVDSNTGLVLHRHFEIAFPDRSDHRKRDVARRACTFLQRACSQFNAFLKLG